MTFLTKEGRATILAYILEVAAETSSYGHVYSDDSGEYVTPEELAKIIIETSDNIFVRVLFEGPESEFKVFERSQQGYRTDFIVTAALIQILWHYTKIQPKFRRHEQEESPEGCASIA